jgi:hypothetical protein
MVSQAAFVWICSLLGQLAAAVMKEMAAQRLM